MANRTFNQFRLSLEKQVVELFVHVTFGSSGAVTADTATTKGVASVAKESTAGQYTITLQDKYVKLLGVDVMQLSGSGAPAAPIQYVISQDVSGAKTIVLQYLDGDTPAATNPASGEQAFIRITLGNTSAF